ncbi:2-amino-4-hydroxy-6-hydroxymethyldihydropteridine diphosphokinase [Mangrovicella endophytica]|uniref:2-amino-4-hydroxy-6- hydroxymethyldihydropteridine diphosphokinase n=1 Tax=Mangrovicella endophytica TaxID=2066697 RepID=UPI000C9E8F92|nr:2-amino-4-hydroxy-6-hydroxymethyldihydropteridine diphosphokinase [Mangrovicella endophytica]
MTRRAYLGLGGNLGDPAASMATALQAIDARMDAEVAAVSRLYRTPPWGVTDQPDFINACAAVDTDLSALALLDLCLSLELTLKRERRLRWGPRTVDIDLLDYAGEIWTSDRLTLPHPRIAERAFVLVPLAEIAPDLPIEGATVSEWLERVDASTIQPVSADGSWWRTAG